MNRTKKIILAILVIVVIALVAMIAGVFYIKDTNPGLTEGNKNILVCAIDEGEDRPGMGACDMAFIVNLDNGTIKNYIPVYPGGMTHPNASEPAEAQEQGAGPALLLHDAFWDDDNQKDMKFAKEIVENQTNISIDAVVAINVKGIDAILHAAGPLEINGTNTSASSIDIIREEYSTENISRGDAVMDIVHAVIKASKDPVKKTAMLNAALNQYSQGNIIMDQQRAFVGLLASLELDSFLG